MNCREAGNALSPYLDGELDARRRAQIEQHVAGCARCSAELAVQRRAIQLLAAPKTMAQPEGLLAEFKQRLAAEAPAPRRTWRNAPWSWSLAGLTAAAAAAALIISLHSGRVAPQDAVVQIAQRPTDLRLSPETRPMDGKESEGASPSGGPGPADALSSNRRDEARREAPTMAAIPKLAEPPVPSAHRTLQEPSPASPSPDSRVAGREVSKDVDAAAGDTRTVGKQRKEPLPAPVMTPFGRRERTNLPLLADKGQLPELSVPPSESKKSEPRLREQDSFTAVSPAPPGAPAAAPASEAGGRAAPADGQTTRRDEGNRARIATAAAPARSTAAPAPAEARLEVTVHRPYPDTGDRAPAPVGGFSAGPAVGLRGGAGGGGAPVAAPAGPQGPPAASATLAAPTTTIAPEVAAALRAPVNVQVTNETLQGLTERLTAAAAVPIVVEDAIARQMRVTAELNGVPLYRALETVAGQANLVIAPRSGGIALQLREAATPAQGEAEKRASAQTVWSPAWGTLPRSGFAVALARSPDPTSNRQSAGARGAFSSNTRGNAGAVNNSDKKEAVPNQRRMQAADQALAAQNQQTLQKAAGQLNALNSPPPLLECPHCHRALSPSAAYLCPRCKQTVKATDAKCARCSEATPAHCPHCRQPLATRAKAPGSR